MTAWWSNERISTTVNAAYIERELGSKNLVEKVHRVLAFGDGLTDDTYLDWILERSPRFFLILNEIGVPEKIFEIIDKSFADDDLPLSQDTLWELNLFGGKSETLDKKFHREQFNFLIQDLEPGGHVDYGDWAVVPVEPFVKRPGIAKANDKVYVHGNLYIRKKVAAFEDDSIDEVQFIMHLKSLSNIRHPHLVSIWSSYSQENFIYILLTPATETTLKSFLEEQPKAFKSLDKAERREIFLTWTHCLAAALAYLHDRGFTHQTIRPGTITVDHNNKIYLGEYSALKSLEAEESPNTYNGELYDHSAPENWLRKPRLHEVAALKTILPGGGRTSRRIPKTPTIEKKTSLPLPSPPVNTTQASSKSGSSGSSTHASRPRNALITTFTPTERRPSIASSSTSSRSSKLEAADVFSLTTVLITLLSMILHHTPKTFASHRSRLNRQAGRGNAPPDASFHKNLPQVVKWLDILAKEAGQREKKDMKFWGSVVEIVQLCRLGVKKEAKERTTARELDYKIGGWVDWGLKEKRQCSCEIARDTSVQADTRSSAEFSSKYALDRPGTVGRPSRPDWLPASEPSRIFESRPQSVDAGRQSTVWGLGDLATLHENMMRPASVMTFDDSTAWGVGQEPQMSRERTRPTSVASGKESTVWGLGEARREDEDDDDDERPAIGRSKSGASAANSSIAMGEVEVLEGHDIDDDSNDHDDEDGDYLARRKEENWPLPLETLALGRGKAKEVDGNRDLWKIGAMRVQGSG